MCVMSQWGWHTDLCGNKLGFYTLDDAEMTSYKTEKGIVRYASEIVEKNEDVYNWLRHNPHRLNLAKIALVWDGAAIKSTDITDVRQELDLYGGILKSEFKVHGVVVSVITICAKNSDVIGFSVRSSALVKQYLKVSVAFPYGSYKKNASDWQRESAHTTRMVTEGGFIRYERKLDKDCYYVGINGAADFKQKDIHEFLLSGECNSDKFEFTVSFSKTKKIKHIGFNDVKKDSETGWNLFWQSGGAVDFSGSADSRANELERRTVLSQYLTAVNCAGSSPPQETGLTCNSWYGKFHLEMHILHSGWFPLWGKSQLLEKSLNWYESVLDNALKNADRNGYKGARWMKMTAPEGEDSPSRIAVLLIWQQPHILYMLELIRRTKTSGERAEFTHRYWRLVRLTAEFMCDFVSFNEQTGLYNLPPPLIPAQEEFSPETVINPTFELCYWRFGLNLAISWARELGEDYFAMKRVYERIAMPSVRGNAYMAHQNCPDTFEKYNRDHPSMLFGYGFINDERIDKNVMSTTCDNVLENWDFKTAWGWDFALIAMTLTRLGRANDAINLLLMDTEKNSYVASGNNYQRERNDLPLYLPGNGSLLFALALMLAGYGDNRGTVGFPNNGMWNIKVEGISPLPY